jgi:glyoxylase-like metal-dependent hydrolase (beta-lactamase superfamily II)
MSRVLRIAAMATIVTWPVAARAQDAKVALEAAATALGVNNLNSVHYSGWGSDYIFGQAYDGNSPWPRFYLPSYTISIDYTTPAMTDDRTRVQGQNEPLGGGYQPLLGESRQIWSVSGKYAWNMVGDRAAPAGPERDMRPAVDGRLAQIWLTPHGFIKAALASGNSTASTVTVRGAKRTVISFTTSTNVKIECTLDERNLVERIETWLDNPFLGDTLFEAVFSNYADFDGVQFPTHILQREGGYPVLDINITDVKPNAPVAIQVPANITQPRPGATEPEPQKISDGIWHFRGGSVVVELKDYVVVIEAPTDEERSISVIDWIKKTIPRKPIRYLINTHSHFDHAGGMRTYAAEGIPILTWAGNIPYYDEVFSLPHTLNPDRLAKSNRKALFEGIVGTRTLSDGTRSLIIYDYAGTMHNPGMLMVFLPKEKILVEADSFYGMTKGPAEDVAAGYANFVRWYDVVQRLKLDIETIIPIHQGAGQAGGSGTTTLDEVKKALETYKDTLAPQ